jgi:hypothetical protein
VLRTDVPPAPAALPVDPLFEHREAQGDDEEEETTGATSGGSTAPAIDTLLSRFASPPGESAHTAIPVDAVPTRITPIAQLRQSQPVTDKTGKPFVSRQRSLTFGNEMMPSSQPGSSAVVPQAALWSLRDEQTGYPPLFTFWSLLLMFCDPTFIGYFRGDRATSVRSTRTGAPFPL